jgi:hypothetical protein
MSLARFKPAELRGSDLEAAPKKKLWTALDKISLEHAADTVDAVKSHSTAGKVELIMVPTAFTEKLD